ncbi:hypothetical protein AB4097_20835 [Microvirga sp. 2MCAF35]|uniref:hypothetical protein n=1 Tax=Microvirga sp. 2MCAF35 TaxID=3232987 RepID=UPI003F9D7100
MAVDKGVEERRRKATEFLWIVQSGLLGLAADSQRADPERDSRRVVNYSGSGTFIRIDEAVRAASLIPDEKSAAAAAKEFCDFWNAAGKDQRVNPGWFARYGMERRDYTLISKADQFLWIVQTVTLSEAANQATYAPKKPELYGYSSILQAMADAVRASKLIPETMDVTEAANEFSSYSIPGMREKRTAPRWYREERAAAV